MSKVILVTGSAKGIGASCIKKFALEGYNVIIHYLKSEKRANELENWVKENTSSKVLTVQCDITKEEEIQNMKTIIEEVESKNMDFFDTVNEAICKLLKYRKEKDFLNVISREAEWLKDPILVKNLALIDTQIQNYIKSKLQKAKEKGFIEFTNLDVTAFLVYKMYIALIIEWSDKDKTMDEQMIANSISEIIKRGLRKE